MDCRLELAAGRPTSIGPIAFYVDQGRLQPRLRPQGQPGARFVQLTPRGSACSIAIGVGVTPAEPGSVVGMQVVVDDADAAARTSSSTASTRARSRSTRGAGSRSSPT